MISGGNLAAAPHGSGVPIEIPQGFLAGWPRGIARPPEGAITATSTFPGKGDAAYADNTRIILRGVEGNWFHAWSEWEEVAHPLLLKAPKAAPPPNGSGRLP